MNPTIEHLARVVLDGGLLTREQAADLTAAGQADFEDLLYWADRIRRNFFGNTVRICSIVPGRLGGCTQDCAFCAQSMHYDTAADKTPKVLSDEEIFKASAEAAAKGLPHLGIVYSGKSISEAELERLIGLVGQIRQRYGIQVCAGLGILNQDQMNRLAAAGVSRYNHNLETSQRHFKNIVSTHSFDQRVRTIEAALKAGLGVCAGGIFGIGETQADRIDMALQLRQLGVDTAPMNFLHPIPGTPLGTMKTLQPRQILSIIALYRFLLPKVNLKIAGGRVLNLRDMQSWIFRAGCTSILSCNYLTTAGRAVEEDLQMLNDLGLEPA